MNTAVNDTRGAFVLEYTAADRFRFQYVDGTGTLVNGNFAAITAPPGSGYYAYMIIPKNRISMHVRFTCSTNQFTNYISAVHS